MQNITLEEKYKSCYKKKKKRKFIRHNSVSLTEETR